jgi:DNA-binding CsgD family transcriptional regulator
MTGKSVMWLVVAVQAICAIVFVWDILASVLGLRSVPISWQLREFIEIGAGLGLVLGVLVGGLLMKTTYDRSARIEGQLRAARGAFAELIDDRFAQWGLTPAERDVALFSIKGLSTQEIAVLRETSDGTVKAQTNAIYRKAGVSGRSQLLSLFIDDLLDGPLA